MSDDIARLNLAIDTGDTQTAKAEIVRSLDDIKNAAGRTGLAMDQVSKDVAEQIRKSEVEFTRVYGSGSAGRKSQDAAALAKQVADAYTSTLEASYNAARAQIKAAEASQFITPAEAKKYANAAAIAYNAEKARTMRSINTQGAVLADGVGMAGGQEVYNAMANGLKKVNEETPRSIAGLGRLRYTMAPLAAAALDLPPIFGRIGSVLGAFAVGGVVTLAVVAGLAVMGWAWHKLSEDTQKDADRMKKSWEEVIKIAEKAKGLGSADQVLSDAKRRLADDANKEGLAHAFGSLFKESFGGAFQDKSDYEKSRTQGSEAQKTAEMFLTPLRKAASSTVGYIPKLWEDMYAAKRIKDQAAFDIAKPVLTAQSRNDKAEPLVQRLGAGSTVFSPQDLAQAKKMRDEALANYHADVKSGNNDAAKQDLSTYTALKSAIEGTTKSRMADNKVVIDAETAFTKLKQQSDALIASTQQQDGPLLQFRNKITEVKNAMDALDKKYETTVKKTPQLTAQHKNQHDQFAGILSGLTSAQGTLEGTEREKISATLDKLAGKSDTSGVAEAAAQLAEFDNQTKELKNNILSLSDGFEKSQLLAKFNALIPTLRTETTELGKVNVAAKATASVLGAYRAQDDNTKTGGLDTRLKELQTLRATLTTDTARKAIDDDINRVLDVRNNILNDQQKMAKEIKALWTDTGKNLRSAWSGLFDDVLSGQMHAFSNFFGNILKMFRQMLAQMAAIQLINYVKKPVMGFITKMIDTMFPNNNGPAIPDKAFGVGPSLAQKSMAGLGIGVAAGTVGYGLGSMTTNQTKGTLMGAAGGAATGAAIGAMGGPIGVATGAIIGGLVGGVAGLFGSSQKAKQAAKDMQEARKQFTIAMDDYVASASKTNSALKQSLAQNEQQRQALIAGANAAYPGKKREKFREQQMAEINEAAKENAANMIQDFRDNLDSQLNLLQGNNLADQITKINKAYDENLASVKAAGNAVDDVNKANQIYALSLKQVNDAYKQDVSMTKGSLQVRALQARGQDDAAAALKLQIDQQKELADATAKWGQTNPEIITQLKQVQALEKANGAAALSTAVRNGPEGFRVESYTTQFAVIGKEIGQEIGSAITDAFSEALSSDDIKAPTVIFNLPAATFKIDGSTNDPEQNLQSMVNVLRQKTLAISGINGKLSATLDKL